jgi:hypothetical protein
VERESPVAVAEAADLSHYSPTVAWAIERDGTHTRLNLVPAAFTRNKRGPFRAYLRLYTDDHPGGVPWASPFGQFDRDLRVELADAFPEQAVAGFEGYVEVVVTSPRQDLRPQHFNEVWLDYHSDDGRLRTVLPTIQFYGSVKRTLGGQDQLWPGLVATATFRSSLLVVNPYEEALEVRLTALAPDGREAPASPLVVPPRRQRRWRLPEVIPGLVESLAPCRGVGTLLVATSHKAICYFMIENVRTGTITGMDHLAYFYGEEF